MMAFALTKEQQDVIDYVCANHQQSSCIVQAFAGSGKTTLLINLAKQRYLCGLGCTLLVTFSARLKEHTRDIANTQEGLFVESFHSLVCNVLWRGHECNTEAHLKAYLALEQKPTPHIDFLKNITLVVVDEMQDMNRDFYEVLQQLRSFFTSIGKNLAFVGVGDFFQWLFANLNASSTQYMCEAESYFPADRFEMFKLSTSFRLTPQMCEWINKFLDPRKLALQYPQCWAKYGESITQFWGNGLTSARCGLCGALHPENGEHGHYSTRSIREMDVTYCDVNSFESLLPPHLALLATKGALVIVNGRQTDRYAAKYPNVTNPFSFKGLQAPKVIVVGCDSFTEEVCAPKANLEDWPLACYCQMYVSCTRGWKHLFVVRSRSQAPFFTIRQHDFVLSIGDQKEKENNNEHEKNNNDNGGGGTRNMLRILDFVAPDKDLDDVVTSRTLLVEEKEKKTKNYFLGTPPDTVPGRVPGTVIRSFGKIYERAVILATYWYCIKTKFEITDWTLFIREHILRKNADAVSTSWVADAIWCECAVQNSIRLLDKAHLNVRCDRKCMETFETLGLRGTVDFFVFFMGLVTFDFGFVAASAKAAHKSRIQFECYKKHKPKEMLLNCFLLNPIACTLHQIDLNCHPDYYLGEMLRRKKWDFLLDQRYSLQHLLFRGVSIPMSKLRDETTNNNDENEKNVLPKQKKSKNTPTPL